MAKIKKASPKKRAYRKRATASLNAEIFEIEVSPPAPSGRSTLPETLALFEKIDRTIEQMKLGQAFIVPASKRVSIRRHLNDTFPADRFALVKIADNPDNIRIYKLLPPKK